MNKISKSTKIISFLLLVSLSACSSNKPVGEVNTAAIPLNDLNLVKGKIPEVLKQARENPYAIPNDQSCAALNEILIALNNVLKADYDDDKTYRTSKTSTNVLNNAVKSSIPFRSWLRKLSGAERHSKKVVNAVAAGIARRAFIKGIKSTKQCPQTKQLTQKTES